VLDEYEARRRILSSHITFTNEHSTSPLFIYFQRPPQVGDELSLGA
jgi:hypothetical protein